MAQVPSRAPHPIGHSGLANMGSFEHGTMCAYCAAEEAGYIPDGCVGPMCGSCMDLMFAGGHPEAFRLARRAHALRALCRLPGASSVPCPMAITVFMQDELAIKIARCLIWL